MDKVSLIPQFSSIHQAFIVMNRSTSVLFLPITDGKLAPEAY